MALNFMSGEKLDVTWELGPLSGTQLHVHSPATSEARPPISSSSGYRATSTWFRFKRTMNRRPLRAERDCSGTPRRAVRRKVWISRPTLKQMAREAAPFVGNETNMAQWHRAPPARKRRSRRAQNSGNHQSRQTANHRCGRRPRRHRLHARQLRADAMRRLSRYLANYRVSGTYVQVHSSVSCFPPMLARASR